MSEREPELGLGIVAQVEPTAKRITIEFPATRETRTYALGTAVLKRVHFRVGDSIVTRGGREHRVDAVEEDHGALVYISAGQRIPERDLSDLTAVGSPVDRLLAGQTDTSEVFDLRLRTLQMQSRWRQSPVRGFLGGRVELIPHQFYILHEVSSRQVPRVLLADEVGLGKTIEAGLILQRLLTVGRAQRVLILVPESLVHQWLVELLRRFNLWFTIFDQDRCGALEQSDPGRNPFQSSQLGLAALPFLARDEERAARAVAAGWDLVVVDEAHHLAWSPEASSSEYQLVERLAANAPGLLLLTATPMQLGLAGHFARLRLLDPNRYHDYDAFLAEAQRFETVAEVADKIVAGKPLTPKERQSLERIFNRDPERLREHLDALRDGRPGAREALLRTLLDQHGTGRVMFRNTRAAMPGFPGRSYRPAILQSDNLTLLARVAREMQAEEAGEAGQLRYSFRDDPRIHWLADFLRTAPDEKVLLICRNQRKASAIEVALQDKIRARSAVFHEGLPLVQRDRNAAWFAEPDGAQLLLCSEIGSEGRNFQFAHHLVLFDLPLNPGLVEQRIGRLDRIGQTQTIQIHVPCIGGSVDERVAAWYHLGLDAFSAPVLAGTEYADRFRSRLLQLANGTAGESAGSEREWEALIEETRVFRQELHERLRRGRDRLLELNSFDRGVAARVIERVRAADADVSVRQFLFGLLDHFGVRVKEHEGGEVFLDPSHAYVPAFPSIPADGMLATFDRQRASQREDLRLLSSDHPLVRDAMDLLIDSPVGTTAFGRLQDDAPNLLLEAVFVLEAVVDPRWEVDRFLAPTPVRVVVDLRGADRTADYEPASLRGYVQDSDLHRFLERPGFSAEVLQTLVDSATERAEVTAENRRRVARTEAEQALGSELQRLIDLQRVNDHVRPAEIELGREQVDQVRGAIGGSRLRLDSVRLIVTGAPGD